MESGKKSGKNFRFADLLVVLFCLSGAVYSVNLFRIDLFQTINGQNKTAIGTVTIKRNTVQRRMSDRVLWDRLIKASPVYSDDTIRVAESSEAAFRIGGNDITLNENTLIRIRRSKDGTDQFEIELASGNMDLVTAEQGKKVILNIMGRKVEAKPGTALTAAAKVDGMALQVSEGAATVVEKGGDRELAAGAMIALDTDGFVRPDPAVVMIKPRPSARYRSGGSRPMGIDFTWNRINLPPNEKLRLEIAEDQYFSRIVRTLNDLNDSAQAALNAGQWYWRLIYNGAVLGSGNLTIYEGSGPELLSPAMNQQFYYEAEPPKLYFQWSEMDDVSYYILEVDVTAEFRNPIIKKQTTVASYAGPGPGPGIWYWRVTPVFSQTYEGGGSSPRSASFRLIEGREPRNAPLVAAVAEEPSAKPPPQPSAKSAGSPAGPPPRVTLMSPEQGTTIPGLTALRQQTVFRWNSEVGVAKSRFVLSRNANPLRGKPEIEILDPNRTVRVDRLKEGVWYWTIEAQTPEGVNVSARTPRQLKVLPIPLLPAPVNLQPAAGYRIGIQDLKNVNVNLTWSPVAGANGYIFTLYQETDNKRRQIMQTGPDNRALCALNIKTLGRGNFIWRVEAVSVGQNGVIEQRGAPGENHFVVDIPRPGPVQIIEDSEDIDD